MKKKKKELLFKHARERNSGPSEDPIIDDNQDLEGHLDDASIQLKHAREDDAQGTSTSAGSVDMDPAEVLIQRMKKKALLHLLKPGVPLHHDREFEQGHDPEIYIARDRELDDILDRLPTGDSTADDLAQLLELLALDTESDQDAILMNEMDLLKSPVVYYIYIYIYIYIYKFDEI